MTAAAPIEEAMAGSEEATTELIVLYQKRVAGFVLGLTRERNAVDDLTQSIFFGRGAACTWFSSGRCKYPLDGQTLCPLRSNQARSQKYQRRGVVMT
jgi:hypothetical protein